VQRIGFGINPFSFELFPFPWDLGRQLLFLLFFRKEFYFMEQNIDRQQISDYYNTFCEEEKDLRLNVRHYSVFQHLIKAGLQKNHNVLEIGCGFGTVTSLIAKYLKRGSILSTDISAERIASCQRQFKNKSNASFVLTDMTDFKSDIRFDFIVLPDVLEHIPMEAHPHLFQMMASLLKDDGSIFIHLPHPAAIEYLKLHNPAALQIIDQSIPSDFLANVAYANGLMLHYLSAYCLANEQPDYEVIVFKKRAKYSKIVPIPASATRWKKARARFFFWWNRNF
jgi:trans-aconitate 2-methyltransferase